MLLHFIFVIKEKDLGKRNKEFEYVKKMALFYQYWIKKNFSKQVDIKCEEMITTPRIILQKLDTHDLLKDHRQRGEKTYHFYLIHFRPLWTDCTCEGFHQENFGLSYWQPLKNEDDILFLAEKNCTVVSHEIAHEFLRQNRYKRYVEDVHDIWTRHYFDNLPFEKYDKNYDKTNNKPYFMTIDVSSLRL